MKSNKRAAKLKYWQEIDQAYEASGLSLKDFCSSKNIGYKTFSNYRYRIKQIQARYQDTSPLFIPAEIKTTSSKDTKPQSTVNPSSHSSLILQFSNTIQLQIPIEAVSSHLLRIVFSALEVM